MRTQQWLLIGLGTAVLGTGFGLGLLVRDRMNRLRCKQ
jgi:hypothetical protein